ncbi:MAG: DUF748 domain-containing protein [Candidatus Omnitrophica bacterium]|nr:DUF748 domain-containing protein [Candidatus Omnitrophota bacterium]
MIKSASPYKKIFIIVISLTILAVVGLFIGRYQILQYSTEKIVRKLLPDYIVVEKMNFNYRDSKIIFSAFKILNPPNFSNKYLIEIGEMECRYKMKGKNILDGIEILEPVFKKPVLFIERLAGGRTNLQEMTSLLQKKDQEAKILKPAAAAGSQMAADSRMAGGSNLSKIVKLPENFIIKDGRVVFLDGMVRPGTYTITLDNVDAALRLALDSSYTRALSISTTGMGIVNGRPGETIKWDTKFDPTARELTMSNRFNVSGVDILAFRPYYDRYSPLVFNSGYFSGSLIFDFDNGSIGSTNEVLLSKISFSIKRGYENAQFLETTVPDLVKYFTSASGDIIFDFKIKGRMSDPQFYLGPISKQAVAAMAIDKITQALSNAAKGQASPQSAGAIGTGKSSDIEKASEYINMFKGLLKEKQ